MAYTTAEAQQELLDGLAVAAGRLGQALADLGAAYELLDEQTADRLEEELFGPVQRAYGRTNSTAARFAEGHGLNARRVDPAEPGPPSTGAKGLIDAAVEAVLEADAALSEQQDSQFWAEAGDVELRAGITDVRQLLGAINGRARELERTLGR